MSLRERFTVDLKTAMLAKESQKVATLRLIIAKMKEKDIEARPKELAEDAALDRNAGIADSEIITLMANMIKQRRESIEQFTKGNRPELAAQEQAEIAVIETYMPKQMSEDEAKAAIATLVGEIGASSIKDMGRVMAELKTRFAGQMDFTRASALVKEALAA